MPRSSAAIDPDSHLYLIDGSGFIFRAFHALPALTRKSDGLPVGAVAGFCNMLWKMLDGMTGENRPTHLAVIFDYSSKSFRNEIYKDYKAQRPEPPEDLAPQFPLIREATRAFGLPCVELENYEADDLIATYARLAAAAGAEVTIVSSDKDLMQLVADQTEGGGTISMLDPMKNREIKRAEVIEKFGVGPERVVDVQALAGDSVDNVPGAPGIGVKTAAQLIEAFGDLETLLAQAETIKQPKRRQTLIEHAEQIRVSKKLVTLDCAAPTPEPLEDFALGDLDGPPLVAFLKAMEFRTLTNRVAERLDVEAATVGAADVAIATRAAEDGAPATEDDAPSAAFEAPVAPAIDRDRYEIIRDEPALQRWIEKIVERGWVAFDTETNSLDEMRAELVGVSLAVELGDAAYIPLDHKEGAGGDQGDLLTDKVVRVVDQLDVTKTVAALKGVLEDPAILKIGQNLKYDLTVMSRYGVEVAPIDDTMLMSYALASGLRAHGMDALSRALLDHECVPIKELIGSGKSQITFDFAPLDKAAVYAAEDADVTLRLHRVLKPQLARDGLATVYETLERPLAPVLAKMEQAGVRVDRDHLSRMSSAFAQKMAGLEAEIHELAGEPFNVGSPKQLGEVLFDKLSLQPASGAPKKTKTGAYGTGADILEELAALGHDLPARVLDWRQVSKLKSTYTDALQEHIHPETGRVHTSFSLAATTTGRLASTDPNLQNIPIRTDEGRQIREAFIADDGAVLLSLDYSQIELRILAHIADIEALKAAFRDGQDIHAMTASEVFGVPIEGMDPMVRRRAKAINFGVIYGISAYGLSNQLRIPQGEAKAFIDAYFEKFPGIRDYMDKTKAAARKHGYVETLFGRRIHTPEINTKGPRGGFAARAAINAPIQGAAADVIRRAMIRIPPALAEAGLSSKMLLQVHDELLFETPAAEVDETIALVKDIMENAAKPAVEIAVPLVVEAGQGANWAAAH